MIITLERGDSIVRFDLSQPLDLSIRLDFQGEQPNAFYLSAATAKAVEVGTFVGDTRRGGGANCFDVFLNPHGNGTHTECRGHVLKTREYVTDALSNFYSFATLLTIRPVAARESEESYASPQQPEDLVLTRKALEEAYSFVEGDWREALLVRTLPNPPDKCNLCYSGQNPPYFTTEAMEWIVEMGFQHLLVDLPSVDREEDGGVLPNHCLFWKVDAEREALTDETKGHTITEFFFAEDSIVDGRYLLELQVPPFALDAAPSRPVLYAPASLR